MAEQPEYLTAAQICSEYAVSIRTVRRALASGLRFAPGKATGFGGRGRATKMIRRQDWLAFRDGEQLPQAGGAPAEPAGGIDVQRIDTALSSGNLDELQDMRTQLRSLRRAAYEDIAAVRAGKKLMSPGSLLTLNRSFSIYAEALRRLEKEMPEILYRKHRYVDATEWGEVLARAAASQAAELDQVGSSVADLCVGKAPREIRTLIDEAIAAARRHIAKALEDLCASCADNASR